VLARLFLLLDQVNQLSDAMHEHGKVVSIDASPCVNEHWQVRKQQQRRRQQQQNKQQQASIPHT
jgi:hypothetical protein